MDQHQTLSRRNFVKAASVGAAALAATSAATALADEAANAESWDEEADMVVIGLGAAGSAAAVTAIENGLSVAVVEHAGRGGGSTILSGGLLYMGGTKLQAELGVEDSADNMLAYVTKSAGLDADPDLVKIFCSGSGDLYDWCVDHGMTFDGTVDTEGHNVIAPAGVVLSYSGNERAWEYEQVATPAPRGHSPNGGGAGIFEPLEKTVEEKASVHYNTQGTGLVTDDAGAVVGITAVDADGNELRIKANKGVVVSAGAFTMNDAMLSDYAPYALATSGRTGCQYDDGSGILMGMKVGAATKSLSVPNIQEFIYRFQDMPCGVMVDFRGHRFLGEDWYGTWIGRNVQQHTPDQAYLVVDSAINEHVDDNLGLQQAVLVAQADTVEDLAAQLGIDAGNLQATLDRYNSLVAAGEDTDFHKSAEYLKPVETAPFYAYDFSLAMCGFHTLGGLKINADAQVVDVEGNPIEGLYAAGRSSNGIFGYYPGSGSSIADALTFGRIAGQSISAK